MARGRPKSADPREIVVRLRLTVVEFRHLQRLSLTSGRSLSEVLRALLRAGMSPEALSALELGDFPEAVEALAPRRTSA